MRGRKASSMAEVLFAETSVLTGLVERSWLETIGGGVMAVVRSTGAVRGAFVYVGEVVRVVGYCCR